MYVVPPVRVRVQGAEVRKYFRITVLYNVVTSNEGPI